jgi:hypothetical protein
MEKREKTREISQESCRNKSSKKPTAINDEREFLKKNSSDLIVIKKKPIQKHRKRVEKIKIIH